MKFGLIFNHLYLNLVKHSSKKKIRIDFFFFFNVSELYFKILLGGVAFSWQPVHSGGKSFQIFCLF